MRFPDGGYDAWMIWNTRARFLVRAADFHTAFSPRLLFWLHQDYPWLVPGAVAQAFMLQGHGEPLAVPNNLLALRRAGLGHPGAAGRPPARP